MAADDRDTVLDLHATVARAYAQGNFEAQIDYHREPPAPIKDEDRQWVGELLDWPIEMTLTHKEIVQAAYFIWMEQGCPDGRADEHWQLAVERLKHERENSETGQRTRPARQAARASAACPSRSWARTRAAYSFGTIESPGRDRSKLRRKRPIASASLPSWL
jgi:hypothetical protein